MAKRRTSNGLIIGTFVLAGAICIAMTIAGVMTEHEGLIAGGPLGLVVVIVGAAVAAWVGRATPAAAPLPSAPSHRLDLQPVISMLEQIQHQLLLSDDARRVLYHEQDVQMIRDAVEHDLAHGEYAAAETLCARVESIMNLPEEAAHLRARIEQARHMESNSAFMEAMQPLTEHLEARDWAGAHAEAGRLKRQYPEAAAHIDQHIHHARQQHKHALQAEFNDAAAAHDVERAMDLLHQLDRFLSPEEAAALAATAQQVIAEHRENLSAMFKRAVSEKRWSDAARCGETIMQSYPNTKMAAEVRGMIDAVRTRATEAALSAAEGVD